MCTKPCSEYFTSCNCSKMSIGANVALLNDPETLKWHEAMHQPDWEQFYDAVREEIKSLEKLATLGTSFSD